MSARDRLIKGDDPFVSSRCRWFMSELSYGAGHLDPGRIEVRLNTDDSLDEIVSYYPPFVHFEQMDDTAWWMDVGGIHVHWGVDEDGKGYTQWNAQGAVEGSTPSYRIRRSAHRHKGRRFAPMPLWTRMRYKLAWWLYVAGITLGGEL